MTRDEAEQLHPNRTDRRQAWAYAIANDILREGFSTIESNVMNLIAQTMTATEKYNEAKKKAKK